MISRKTTTTHLEAICKKCGRVILRGMAICLCLAGTYVGPGDDLHTHREAYLPKPMTEIVTLATTTSTGTPPLRLNGQTYYLQ